MKELDGVATQIEKRKIMNKKFYISTAIAYTSAKPHIGNTYEIVLADAIARFKRLDGYDVYFQTGTDEHGEKIETKAKEAGVTPKEYVDNIASEIKKIWDLMNTSYDRFVRTTDKEHEKIVQDIFKKLYDQGDIYKSEYKGLYCVPCESFWTETQAVDSRCPDCGRPLIEKCEEAYFFKMSKYSKWLEEYIETHPHFIEPESRKNEMLNNFIKPGLEDLCVSRTSFKWGIPVSFDDKHVIYVWIDALSNYITFLGYDINGNHSENYKKYWPCDVHLIGKDILRFHTIYWPIILHALGEELPHQVFGHPWLLFGSDKMSKSKGNIVYADDLVSVFGVDAIRYYMLHEMPFASDGTFTRDLLIESINSNLANNLGNLVNRTIGMAEKYFDGNITNAKVNNDVDNDLINTVLSLKDKVFDNMEKLHIADALDNIFDIYRRANKYIDETTPWALAKDEAEKARLQTVLYNLMETIRFGTVLLQAFLPDTANNIFKQINTQQVSFATLDTFGYYEDNNKTGVKEVLFNRIEVK